MFLLRILNCVLNISVIGVRTLVGKASMYFFLRYIERSDNETDNKPSRMSTALKGNVECDERFLNEVNYCMHSFRVFLLTSWFREIACDIYTEVCQISTSSYPSPRCLVTYRKILFEHGHTMKINVWNVVRLSARTKFKTNCRFCSIWWSKQVALLAFHLFRFVTQWKGKHSFVIFFYFFFLTNDVFANNFNFRFL